MKPENLTELTDQELLQKKKQIRTNAFILVIIFGFFVGIAIYAATKKGGFITYIPVVAGFIVLGILENNSKMNKKTKEELNSRNLK